jgi:hypothetical protein
VTIDERLYNLMPAIYRIRDVDDNQTLRAFMAVLERIYRTLQDDIDGLYADWFVETCQERIVPFLADLVGISGLPDTEHIQGTRRRRVANVSTYRRTTGTLTTIEHIARDLTGWPVVTLDLAGLVATTQHTQHAHPDRGTTVDVRKALPADRRKTLDGSPFETTARRVDVRQIAPDVGRGIFRSGSVQGRYNLSNVGVFFWRLQPYPIVRSVPARLGPGRYTFDPTGRDLQLFQPAQTPPPNRRVPPAYLPRPLERRLDAGPPPFSIWLDDQRQPLASAAVSMADLSNWDTPGAELPVPDAAVAVDPVLGRIACPTDRAIGAVSYWYAFSGDIGSGPYSRQTSLTATLASRPTTWQALVSHTFQTDAASGHFRTLAEAVQAWNALPPGQAGVIAVVDNATYAAPVEPVLVASGSLLVLVAARSSGGADLIASGVRPCVVGDLIVRGTAAERAEPGDMVVDGLLCDGGLRVQSGNIGRLQIRHTTLIPSRGGIRVEHANARLRLTLDGSICGPLHVLEPTCTLRLAHSIVDAAHGIAVHAHGARLNVRGSTLFGSTLAGVLDASDSLFTGPVHVDRRQAGGVEYSFVPPASYTPARHRCQPDLALADGLPEEHAWIRARLVPAFTSTRYGDPGYAQLTPSTPSEIRAGATNDGEMGAFYLLYQPLRMTYFLNTLREFLPAGRDVGVFFAS